METGKKRRVTRKRKKSHIRKRISGDNNRPRVSVFRSGNHIYGQVIDDEKGVTIVSVGTLEKEVRDKIRGYTGNKMAASVVGSILGERLKAIGINTVVFDRSGFLYHGRIKSFADGVREAGIKF